MYDKKYFRERYSWTVTHKYRDRFNYRNLSEFVCEASKKGELILDIACGLGTLSYFLTKCSNPVIGVDISHHAIKKAKELYSEEDNPKFIVASGQHLPFKKECVDHSVVSHLFEHLSNEEARTIQKECHRILKKNGTISVDQPMEGKKTLIEHLGGILIKNIKFSGHGEDPTHKRKYTTDLLINELKSVNFAQFTCKPKRRHLIHPLIFIMYTINKKKFLSRYQKLHRLTPPFLWWLMFINIPHPIKGRKTSLKS